jgi:hypothetical protein
VNELSESTENLLLKRPLFITTVPRGVFLPPPTPPSQEIVAKPRHVVYAYASHPRILDQQSPQQQRRRDIIAKQISITNNFNQFLHRNLIAKNIRAFDEHAEARLNQDNCDGDEEGIAGVKITRTR